MNVPRPALRVFLATLILLIGLAAESQGIRIGGLEGNNAVFTGVPATIIDWSRPASTTGSVNTASVAWSGATSPCDGIFYVRFYVIPSNSLASAMTAERGPFRAVSGINTVPLDPPVSVTPDTFIGVRRMPGPDSCGQPYGTFTREAGRALFSSQDFQGGPLTLLSPAPNFRLQAQASNTPSVRVSTIPVVGSGPGSSGSFFRTGLTLSNPSPFEIRGKLVMRLAGRSGTDADPSLDYVIPKNGTLNYADIVDTMDQDGLGSIDILTTASPTPLATARVFNDAGVKGTSGLVEDAVPARHNYYSVATVLIPEDQANYRLNIGIRTFAAVTLTISIYNDLGGLQAQLVRSYPSDFFEQSTSSQFVEGSALPSGGKIVVSAFEKEFIVYGALTDSRTNDPSMRIGSD